MIKRIGEVYADHDGDLYYRRGRDRVWFHLRVERDNLVYCNFQTALEEAVEQQKEKELETETEAK